VTDETKRLGRNRFYVLVRSLTKQQTSARGAVDAYYAEYGIVTHDRVNKMIESIESLLDVAEAAIVIPPLQAVSDFVFKFLHEDFKAHLHACVAGNLQAPPAIPVRSFRTVHKYATLPSHERLPPVVPACGSDSESASDKSDPDDSGAGVSDDDNDDQDSDDDASGAIVPVHVPALAGPVATAVPVLPLDVPSLTPGGVPPLLPLSSSATVVVVGSPPASIRDVAHDPYAALVKDGVGVVPSTCEACNSCDQLFVYLRSRIALVRGVEPILGTLDDPSAIEDAVGAASASTERDKLSVVADLYAATARFQVNYRCWRAHMLRSIVQSDAVDRAIVDLSPDSVLVLLDFKV
jgi:hypothetical protein